MTRQENGIEPPAKPINGLSHSFGLEEEDIGQARRVGGNMAWGQAGRILELGLGMAFAILVVRALGPQDYAIYAVVWSIVGVSALVASLGYGETLARFLPEVHLRDKNEAAALFRRLLSERALASLLITLAVWTLARPLSAWTHTPALENVIVLVAALILSQGIWEFFVSYYNAALRMRDHAIVRLVGQTASLLLSLALFLVFGIYVWVPLFAMLVSYLLSILIYGLGARDAFLSEGKKVDFKPIRRFGGYVWLTNLATFGLAGQVDVLLIAVLLSDNVQVSFYNVSLLLLSKLYSLLTGWGTVLLPAAAEARARNGSGGLSRSFNLYMKLNLFALLPALIFVAAWSGPLITTFFGPSFAPAAPLLLIASLFTFLSALSGANICQPLLYVANRQKFLLALRIGAGILNILLDIILIPRLGAAGAVLGTSTSNLATHLVEFLAFRKMTPAPYPLEVAIKLTIASGLAVLPVFFIQPSNWISLVVGAIGFVLIFTVVTLIARPYTPADLDLLSRVAPRLRPFLRYFTLSGS